MTTGRINQIALAIKLSRIQRFECLPVPSLSLPRTEKTHCTVQPPSPRCVSCSLSSTLMVSACNTGPLSGIHMTKVCSSVLSCGTSHCSTQPLFLNQDPLLPTVVNQPPLSPPDTVLFSVPSFPVPRVEYRKSNRLRALPRESSMSGLTHSLRRRSGLSHLALGRHLRSRLAYHNSSNHPRPQLRNHANKGDRLPARPTINFH
mmetsp:Transcript_11542/g.33337  ORF Transcript_11542/g.33337 Transcript_11542/m.33337 type:complete len:203 (-) Transcript_11542:34-642(-)